MLTASPFGNSPAIYVCGTFPSAAENKKWQDVTRSVHGWLGGPIWTLFLPFNRVCLSHNRCGQKEDFEELRTSVCFPSFSSLQIIGGSLEPAFEESRLTDLPEPMRNEIPLRVDAKTFNLGWMSTQSVHWEARGRSILGPLFTIYLKAHYPMLLKKRLNHFCRNKFVHFVWVKSENTAAGIRTNRRVLFLECHTAIMSVLSHNGSHLKSIPAMIRNVTPQAVLCHYWSALFDFSVRNQSQHREEAEHDTNEYHSKTAITSQNCSVGFWREYPGGFSHNLLKDCL